MFRRLISRQPNLMLALLALTLAIRVIVPSGFMPTTDANGVIRILMCSGVSGHEAFIDLKTPNKESDAPTRHHDDHPCAFSGLGTAFNDFRLPAVTMPLAIESGLVPVTHFTVSIGRGLAAPPPPATGPPSLI